MTHQNNSPKERHLQNLNQILDYARNGMPVLPIHSIREDETCSCDDPSCKHSGKHPRTPNGVDDATTDEARIRAWAKKHPGCNWAVAAGAESGIFVVDIDPRSGGDLVFKHLIKEHGSLPNTPAVKTGGGGYHYYFKYPLDANTKNRSIAPGVDLKTDRGYVLVPPSVTEQPYTWAKGRSLDDLPLANLPEWIEEKASMNRVFKLEEAQKIPEGQRNTVLFSLAGTMRRRGMSYEEILAALLVTNKNRCTPPLDQDEVQDIAANSAKYEPEPDVLNPDVEKKNPVPEYYTAYELMQQDFPEPVWIIPGILPEGLAILAGKPKIGKSWMVLNFAIAVASGGKALGEIDVTKGTVFYLSLEDNPRRLKSRINIVLPCATAPKNLHLPMSWFSLDEGGIEKLRKCMEDYPDTRLIIIDTFAKIREKARSRSAYDNDYKALDGLKKLADKHGIAVLIVHHERKADAEDVFDQISGTTGFTGAADCLMSLQRDRGRAEAILRISGRDVEDKELALKLDKGIMTWFILGDAEEYQRTHERQEIVELLRESDDLMGPKDIAASLGKTVESVKYLLSAMLKTGDVIRPQRGRYTVPEKADQFEEEAEVADSLDTPTLTNFHTNRSEPDDESEEVSKVRALHREDRSPSTPKPGSSSRDGERTPDPED